VIGERVPRREDARLLTGRGRYLDDHDVPGLAHVAILRSAAPHARIRGIDVSAARGLPGVIAVVTQPDLDAAGAQAMHHRLSIPGIQPLGWTILATDIVRFVGEPIAAVVATSRAIAEDGCELIEVDYEHLSPALGAVEALAPDAPRLYPEWGTNEFLHLESATPRLQEALSRAPRRLSRRFESHRVAAVPLEGHGAQASFDPATGVLTVIASNQQPHQLRTVIAEVCNLSEARVRVVAPDMGGGFGNKQHFSREECLVALLALVTGRPVRWAQDRTEGLTASIHSRPQIHDVIAGYDEEGRLLALSVRVVSDVGNPVLYFSGIGPSLVTVGALSGGYDIGQLGWSLSCVATNTCPVGAYRGFGQPEAHLTSERVMDLIAVDLGLDPALVRRRNLIPDEPRPWITHDGARIDVGSLGPQLDQLLASFGYSEWRQRQTTMRERGQLVGIGLSTLVQGTAPTQYGVAGRFGSFEMAIVSVLPDGHVTVVVGSKSQGQAHETVLAQVAAAALGVDISRVTVADGDTAALPYGMGSWGSRTAVMAGGAVLQAADAVRKKMAAIRHYMAASSGSGGSAAAAVDPAASGAAVADPATSGAAAPGFDDVAAEAWWHPHRLPPGIGPGLTASVLYSPGRTIPVPDQHGHVNFDETFGSHMMAIAVEVDPVTGRVAVLDALLASDCGVLINPTVVEGQHQGGFAQGLGNVLFEEVRYSPEGQPETATLLDYRIPEASDVPVLRVVHRQTPSELAGGFRGVGEAAIIATPAALAGAVADALQPLGVEITSTRLQPQVLRRLIRDAGYVPDAAAFARA
jgi:carbon-monoxide dehydrogenase large subunit